MLRWRRASFIQDCPNQLRSLHGRHVSLGDELYNDGYSVLLTALEHRYYGSSYPTPNNTYTYLTTPEAIQDVRNFVSHLKSTFSLPPSTQTYTFGGSYPGMISAYSRYTLGESNVIQGSVSSSSPVQGTVEMPTYNEVAGEALKIEGIGGSEECYDIIVNGHEQIGDMLKTPMGRESLADSFNVCGGSASLEKERNKSVFAGDGVVYIPAQENDPSCDGEVCDIAGICGFLISRMEEKEGTEEWEALEELAKVQNGDECVNVDWDEQLEFLKSPAAILGGTNSWMYQTCTGWGFYQTCTLDSSCPYAKGLHNVDQDLEMCKSVFGVEKDEVYKSVERSNEMYNGWNIEDKRILFVNGNVDPWSSLSVTPDNPKIDDGECKEGSFWVDNASHHFWTHEILDTDGVEVQDARARIHETVIGWIKEEEELAAGN
mmetsp:Transcript_16627/g.34317  ORF Transcript_16627/g.34317 Transcript_16627/m.34317 type:complete len:431 (+) Transcript_16627:195-1487(+)